MHYTEAPIRLTQDVICGSLTGLRPVMSDCENVNSPDSMFDKWILAQSGQWILAQKYQIHDCDFKPSNLR